MLKITVPADERFNEETQEFVSVGKDTVLQLEHSLISIHKWEQKWHKPFLSSDKNSEELIDYIRCMTITQNVPMEVYYALTSDNIEQIKNYISDKMTATWFADEPSSGKGGGSRQILTAELIYYYMIALNIPPEYAKWHINSLLTLIEVCNRENARMSGKGPKNKKSKAEQAAEMRALNAERRAKFNTRG